MKTKQFLMGAVAALCMLSGCTKEKKYPPYIGILTIEDYGDYRVSYQNPPEIEANGGTYTIGIVSNVPWTATLNTEATWCRILSSSTSTGEVIEPGVLDLSLDVLQRGNITIMASMLPYTATEGRTATLTLTGTDVSATYTLTQIPGIRMRELIVARTNVDEFGTFADSPAKFGKFYQFNRTVAYEPVSENPEDVPPGWPATYTYENSHWLPENDPCPPGWIIPSGEENGSFVAKSYSSKNIFKIVDIADGFPLSGLLYGNSIETATWDNMQSCFFLPAVSCRDNTGVYDARSFWNKGFYWTRYGLAYSGKYGTIIEFDRNDLYNYYGLVSEVKDKGCALPIRCVKENE